MQPLPELNMILQYSSVLYKPLYVRIFSAGIFFNHRISKLILQLFRQENTHWPCIYYFHYPVLFYLRDNYVTRKDFVDTIEKNNIFLENLSSVSLLCRIVAMVSLPLIIPSSSTPTSAPLPRLLSLKSKPPSGKLLD